MVQTWGQWMFRILALSILIHTSLCLKGMPRGQSDQGSKKVTVIANNNTLRDVFRSIKKQTGLEFFYSTAVLNQEEKVTVNMVDKTLDAVLGRLLQGKGLTWVYMDNIVRIGREEERKSSVGDEVVGDTAVTAQAISGKVVAADGTPIPGATIIIERTKDGATSDAEGKFSLSNTKANDVIAIRSVGFKSREISIKGKTLLVQLEIAVNALDETVVVAYGTSTMRSNVGALMVVKGETIANLPNRSFDKSLQGQVPGLLVTTGSGAPGGGLSNFVLRGIGTGGEKTQLSFRQPLIVIDGVPTVSVDFIEALGPSNAPPSTNALAQLNTDDIETISVLKDASAIALYGSKASNGVILVTTKKGKAGKTSFSFHHLSDVSSPIYKRNKSLNQHEYLELLKESYKNSDSSYWTDDRINSDLGSLFPTYSNAQGTPVFYDQEDWFKAIYNNTAITNTDELSISGGNDKTLYYFNTGYTSQKGTIKHTGFDRLSLRYNFSNQINPWIKIGLNSSLSYTNQSYLNSNSNGYFAGASGFPYTIPVLDPIHLKDGTYYLQPFVTPGSYFNNPLADLEYDINKTQSYRVITSLYGELKFLKDFTFRTDVGTDVLIAQIKQKTDPRLSTNIYSPPGVGEIQDFNDFYNRIINTNVLRYSRLLNGKHAINFLLGQEAQIERRNYFIGIKQGLSIPYLNDLSAATTVVDTRGTSSKTTLLSFFSQMNYSYNGTYHLSLSARRDGSSKFGERNRFGNYWSVGGGWELTNEAFLKQSKLLNYLKIRASIGSSGNSATINVVDRYNLVAAGNYNNLPAGIVTPGNPNIGWEKALNKDMGVDFKVFNERLSGTIDVYKRDISNLLYFITLPPNSGTVGVNGNIGKMQNKGVEVTISADAIIKDNFSWNISFNWSTNKNKLIKADVPLTTDGNFINKEGENFNSFYLVRWGGVNPDNGAPQWLDKDGKVTSTYSYDDRVIVGKPQPDGYGGITNNFRYGNWDLSFLLYYQYGYKIYDETSASMINDGANFPYMNQSKQALDRWQKPGDHAANPKRVLNNTATVDANYYTSTRFLFDGDFVRLKNVLLGYTFPTSWIRRIGISKARLYGQAYNLALLTKFKGIDPENIGIAGAQGFAYPQARSYSLGLDINF
ncbi:TonB-dependent receptor [Chitinophaga agrisoli]|uniref:TonB-dependent receptor n=1 Tax=Chitinophaga agrisoli TaxID=2607653 RepID=A0A5B2VMC1_9BACT|nr:TonB-dependent receptor [Chitinophaga agrisoli]KAA2240181.1 TonB-dependent receptor [Chitinophaga agrisoli]